MSGDKKPLIVKCFHSKREIVVKYVRSTGNYSQINNWEYWTEDKKNKGRWFCDICLVKLYREYKWEFRRLIPNKEKQKLLRQYINSGKIKGEDETFIISKKDKEAERERERERERAKNTSTLEKTLN